MDGRIILFFVLLALSALFAGTEIALASLSAAKVRTLVEQKKRGARSLFWLKENPQRFLSTVLVGNNFVNIALSALVTVLTIDFFGEAWVGAAAGILTLVVLTFAEIMPKTIATAYTEPLSLFLARPMYVLAHVLWPVVVASDKFSSILLAFMGKKKAPAVTEEELKTMAKMAAEEGSIEKAEHEIIERLFRFNDITASDVMTPRVEIFALDANMSLADAVPKVIKASYSRIPVFEGTVDKIVGLVYVRDLLQYLFEQRDLTVPLRQLSREAFFVPHSKPINALFREFQERNVHIAIILDEYGGTEGVVTLEDLLEELVGEIIDETDVNPMLIKRVDKNTIVVDGRTELRSINRFFNTHLPGKEQNTIGDFLLHQTKKIPSTGEEFSRSGFLFVVQDADGRKINRVKIIKRPE